MGHVRLKIKQFYQKKRICSNKRLYSSVIRNKFDIYNPLRAPKKSYYRTINSNIGCILSIIELHVRANIQQKVDRKNGKIALTFVECVRTQKDCSNNDNKKIFLRRSIISVYFFTRPSTNYKKRLIISFFCQKRI